ncbi:MAG: WD40 repeat-containing protein [Hyperionvirus sp.]|uniref:WD40 repeat-containing protein n=1 Tax=Hyperionvirus sp. TaxID=2487770 RepID=A0A3G5AD29_9VIRU|nr:MAG: WD40 repeat-containing protein [Hyperionvirus sp.]
MILAISGCLVESIFSWLEPRDLSRTASVCSVWRYHSGSDTVWKSIVLEQWYIGVMPTRVANCLPYGIESDGKRKEADWQTRYRELMRIKGNWKKGKYEEIKLSGHTEPISTIFCSGDFVFSGSRDMTIRVWHVPSRLCLHVLRGHRGSVDSIYAEENEIISSSEDGTIRIWSRDNGNEKHCLRASDHSGESSVMRRFKCTANRIIGGGSHGRVFIWDRETGSPIKALLMPLQMGASEHPTVESIDVRDNNMAVALGDAVFIFDYGKILEEISPWLTLEQKEVRVVRMLPRSEYALTYGSGYVHIFSMGNGDLIQSYQYNSLGFIPISKSDLFGEFVFETPDLENIRQLYPRPIRVCYLSTQKYKPRESPNFIITDNINASNSIEVLAFANSANAVLTLHDFSSPSRDIPTSNDSWCVIT